MLAGGMALLVFSLIDVLLYIISNAILPLLVKIVDQTHITPLLGMADNTYVIYLIFGMLGLFEIAAVIAVMYIVGRRQISGVDYI